MADKQKNKSVKDGENDAKESFTLWIAPELRQKLNRLAIKRSTEHLVMSPQDVVRDLILKARE